MLYGLQELHTIYKTRLNSIITDLKILVQMDDISSVKTELKKVIEENDEKLRLLARRGERYEFEQISKLRKAELI